MSVAVDPANPDDWPYLADLTEADLKTITKNELAACLAVRTVEIRIALEEDLIVLKRYFPELYAEVNIAGQLANVAESISESLAVIPVEADEPRGAAILEAARPSLLMKRTASETAANADDGDDEAVKDILGAIRVAMDDEDDLYRQNCKFRDWYEQRLTPAEKEIASMVLIYICGWSFETLLERAEDQEEP
jgi:hypothetical protein